LPINSFITLKIYNVPGNAVAVLVNGEKHPVTNEVEFQSAIGKWNLFLSVAVWNFCGDEEVMLLK